MAKTATAPERKSGSSRRTDAERAARDAILPKADGRLVETRYPV